MRHALHGTFMLRCMSDTAKSLLPPRLGLHEARKTEADTFFLPAPRPVVPFMKEENLLPETTTAPFP